jgi:tRNA (mo5U34)-methyltransferase
VQVAENDLAQAVSEIAWYHQIDLGGGLITPGTDDSQDRLQKIALPEDLRGWSVLDVGAWDGFFSFEAERRGANRVLATDSYSWDGGGWGTQAGFQLARRALNSRVEDQKIDVLDLSPERVGVFDLTLFLGVLYHMRHPLLALERMASVTSKMLILDTHVDLLDHARPLMAFYPNRELNDDPTNWWGPNPAAVEAMLQTVGFREVKLVRLLLDQPQRGARTEENLPPTLTQDRAIFHAWR